VDDQERIELRPEKCIQIFQSNPTIPVPKELGMESRLGIGRELPEVLPQREELDADQDPKELSATRVIPEPWDSHHLFM
jgi:hypothetical protein